MTLSRIASLAHTPCPLELVEIPQPAPGRGEILVRVSACGVCHTELDEIEGRAAPPVLPIVLGHEVVGRVAALGEGAGGHTIGDRVGVGWIHSSCGGPHENLSPAFRATGRDAPGGYAEYMTVPAGYAYPVPAGLSDTEAAPLLCAGAIGYRALRLAGLEDGQALGLTGFGGSAHLVLQLARHLYPSARVHVFARDEAARAFARAMGADWAGDTTDRSPEPLHACIDTTPAWKPVVEALANLRPGGRLVINAIRKEDRDKEWLQRLSYHDHLWMEREIKSVANITAADIAELLALAGTIPLRPTVETYPLEDANRALRELREGPVRGAKVLLVDARAGSA
jgi:alcohol dehydrogenase, propanol-preferring